MGHLKKSSYIRNSSIQVCDTSIQSFSYCLGILVNSGIQKQIYENPFCFYPWTGFIRPFLLLSYEFDDYVILHLWTLNQIKDYKSMRHRIPWIHRIKNSDKHNR